MRIGFITLLSLVAIGLASCSGVEGEAKYPTSANRDHGNGDIYEKPDTIFGKGGFFSSSRGKDEGESGSGIGVNAFLWRASLDTVSFMPLASADPFGGVILTDWYSPSEKSDERFKLNVFIMGKQLRSDAIRVRTFRQKLEGGVWRDLAPAEDTETKLEDAILTRARQLRVSQLN